MVVVRFFEKPGCINNTKQKILLEQAGHELDVHDLTRTSWNREVLKRFFKGLPVRSWFNQSAPAVRDNLVNPDVLDEEKALGMMLQDPILIRRPLMQVGDEYMVGFDFEMVDKWIGLSHNETEIDRKMDLETCPKKGR